MTTRIGSNGSMNGSVNGVVALPTATRTTPQPAQPFGQVLRTGAAAVLQGAESAVSQLPGGPVIAAAVRSPMAAAAPGVAPGGLGSAQSATLGGNPASGAAGSSGQGIEGALARQAEDNMYYLSLQQQIQDENRTFSTLSNVLKARHDTVKNSISNLR